AISVSVVEGTNGTNGSEDIPKLLKSHDSTMRINYGEQIIESCRSMKALPRKIRRHLIKISCELLVRKSHSNHPSMDQREQLAECIVYPSLNGMEKSEMKNCFYAPSKTVTKSTTGKRRSLSPTWYLQYFFLISGIRFVKTTVKNKHLFVMPFGKMTSRIMKQTIRTLKGCEENDVLHSSFFMLAALNRSKCKRVTQVDSVRSFIDIVNPLADVDDIAIQCDTKSAHIVCKGTRNNLDLTEFFVIFEKRALKAETLIGAVDLAFKIFYGIRILNCDVELLPVFLNSTHSCRSKTATTLFVSFI
ncbi:unnamed protein product, partial [Allacma fusca]